MKLRHLLAVVAVCTLLSTGFGFLLGAATQPPAAGAASSGEATVDLLKKLNRTAEDIERQLGTINKGTSVIGLLWKTTKNTYEICQDANSDVLCDF